MKLCDVVKMKIDGEYSWNDFEERVYEIQNEHLDRGGAEWQCAGADWA